MLNFSKKAFDEMTLDVKMLIILSKQFLISSAWNNRHTILFYRMLYEFLACITRSAITSVCLSIYVSAWAWVISCFCPAVRKNLSEFPSASTRA